MLDIARAIVEKQSDDTIEKVDILSALAEVALERGMSFSFLVGFLFIVCRDHYLFFFFSLFDSIIIFVVDFYESLLSVLSVLVILHVEDIETSLSDYQKALSILERLVEPDSRQIAELYPFQVEYTYVLRCPSSVTAQTLFLFREKFPINGCIL